MRKIFGVTLGGLQHKIATVVLITLVVTVFAFAMLSVFQSGMLSQIVEETQAEQQRSITGISRETMRATTEYSLTSMAALQAGYANSEFTEVVDYINIMKAMAEELLKNGDALEPAVVLPPDPAKQGVPSAQVLFDEGVDYTKSKYLGIIGHMSEPLLAMYANSSKIMSCFVGLQDGTHLSISTETLDRFDENGNQIPYPVTQRPWYLGAARTGKLYFTGIEEDAFSGKLCITCSAPVYLDGDLIGVVGADVELANMAGFVNASDDAVSSYIINNLGQVILAPSQNRIFTARASDEAQDLRQLGSEPLAKFVSMALLKPTTLNEIELDNRTYYMAGAPMPTIGWALIMTVDKERTELLSVQMLEHMDQTNLAAQQRFRDGSARIRRITFAIVVAILGLSQLISALATRRMVRPIESMTKNIVESGQTGRLFEMKDIYRTDDEIQVLAESFDDLSRKTKRYIEDITKITQEKERISTELELARRIQANMLPYIYPAFPDRSEFDIYATMDPAKEVGGDFYDFFLIDSDHLAMVVADVSGKGVPAALFMMMSKILINNFTMLGVSPARVLEQTNNAICQNNEDDMFITVWLGILEISTGRLVASNAGHEYPVVRTADGRFELYKDKHGFVLGAMEGMKYHDYEMTIDKGGMLFLYTDGVTEATNASNELFGTKRLIEAMNASGAEGPVPLLHAVKDAVDAFVGDAGQFDDLTMLGFKLMERK